PGVWIWCHLSPSLIFLIIVEPNHDSSLLDSQTWSTKVLNKANSEQAWIVDIEVSEKETLDMKTIDILISHNHQRTISQCGLVFRDSIVSHLSQPQYFLYVSNLSICS